MNIIIWIIQSLLALAFLMAGAMKLITPYEEMIASMAWVEDFSLMQVRIIGLLELLGAIGLIAPMFVRKAGRLVPIAALCLALDMAVAAMVHIARDEAIYVPLVLFTMAAITFWGRRDMFHA